MRFKPGAAVALARRTHPIEWVGAIERPVRPNAPTKLSAELAATTPLARVADAALLLLAALLPFETTRAAFSVAGFRFTNVEIVLFITLLLGAAALAIDPARRARVRACIPRTWVLLLGAFALWAFVGALQAPAFEPAALRAAARTSVGLALIPLAVASLPTGRDLGRLAAAVSVGALLSALAGLIEVLSDEALGWLQWFRPNETYQGSIRRLSGPFDHSNIAAMFFEVAIPLIAALAWVAWRRGRSLAAAAGAALVLVLLEALVLTYSRGGIAGVVVSNAVVAALIALGKAEVRRRLVPAASVAVLAAAVIAVDLGASSTARTAIRRESSPDPRGHLTRSGADSRESAPPVLARHELWRAAFHLVRRRPVTGIGLDTFRLTYGPVIGLRQWDKRQHSNSLYVETLVSVGVVGAVVFFAWLALLVVDIGMTLVRAGDVWQGAVAAGLLAYLVHQVVDYFLLFSATGLLFWLLCGSWLAARRASP